MVKQTQILQDSFDRGFVRVVSMLQQNGYIRNESILERELHLSHGRLYEIKRGMRHVPRKHRDHIVNHFMLHYDVNPNVFVRKGGDVFNNDPPNVREDASNYEVERIRATAGDVIYIQKLEDENKHLIKENLLLRKLVSTLEKQLEEGTKKHGK